MPKQLEALYHYFKPETYKMERNVNELKRQVDYKLPTVLLAFAIQEYAQILHQTVDVNLIVDSSPVPHRADIAVLVEGNVEMINDV